MESSGGQFDYKLKLMLAKDQVKTRSRSILI